MLRVVKISFLITWKIQKRSSINFLRGGNIVDVGCGRGKSRNPIRYGARPENVYGLDLLGNGIEQARTLSPDMDFRCANAENLPYPDKSFDIVLQFTMFT